MTTPQINKVLIRIQPTPNPYAWKFILDQPVLNEGKATYSSSDEAKNNLMASALFQVFGVTQVHFFQNVITVTHSENVALKQFQEEISTVIQTCMPAHNPNMTAQDEKKAARISLSPELQRIEEILDETIRPGLQGDGGDLEIVKFEDNKLYVAYQGACGTCPSSTTGTLMAIEGILREQFDEKIEVIPI